MAGNPDVITRVLTGDLIGILLLATVLTWPISWALLTSYRRAVRRTMRTRASGATIASSPPPIVAPLALPVTIAPVDVSAGEYRAEDDAIMRWQLVRRPWRTAGAYALAGLAYVVVLTSVTVWFAEPTAPFRPIRFFLLTTLFALPIVPTVAIVAGSVRQSKLAVGCVYAMVYVALVVIGARTSTQFSVMQGIQLCVIYNAPGRRSSGWL